MYQVALCLMNVNVVQVLQLAFEKKVMMIVKRKYYYVNFSNF
ncbi:hypothetical protein CLU84_0980 [Comamonas sp. 26]|nr:hypothetical protein CLU84_0980 [Comamonas sp. 26]